MSKRIEIIDVGPDLETRALKLSIGNLLRALGETPVSPDYPLPKIATFARDNIVDIGDGKGVIVNEFEGDFRPGERVIIYKQAKPAK